MDNAAWEQVSFRVESGLKKKFDKTLIDRDQTATEVLRASMSDYVSSEVLQQSPLAVPDELRSLAASFLEFMRADLKSHELNGLRESLRHILELKSYRRR
jgi:hypothetical protein